MGFEPDLKFTAEFLQIMGGHEGAPAFKRFVELCSLAFVSIRPYQEAIVSIVALMLDTSLPCFRGQTIKLLRQRFQPKRSEREAAQYMAKRVHQSCLSFRTKIYDRIQFYQNQIPY